MFVVSLFLLSFCLHAQVTGRVTGTVTDGSGAVIAGAAVNLILPGGSAPVVTTSTNIAGLFVITGVRPDFYDLVAEAKGFVPITIRNLKVDPARETSLSTLRLEVAAVSQTVEVVAGAETVQTNNVEISTTVTNSQVRKLPVLDRQALNLLITQPGVSNGRGPVVINGMRTSFTNVTLDGMNIQDNLFRDNSLQFSPNRLAIDQVAEITIATSNTTSAAGAGASQVNLVTPSGTNQLHGSACWYNRNSTTAANGWFNNLDGIEKPVLNQNQFGGSLGGPVKKDKLFFFFNYEVLRLRQQTLANRTILTDDARQGIYTYRDTGGNVQKADLLRLTGLPFDPAMKSLIDQVPAASNINNFRSGDSRPGYVGNTGGYSFNVRSNEVRDNVTSKADYVLSPEHSFAATFVWNDSTTDRPDVVNSYEKIPVVATQSGAKLFSGAWRWNPGPTITNELRAGFNRTGVDFVPSVKPPEYLIDDAGLLFDNPVNLYMAQGRGTNTYTVMDYGNHIRGKHSLQFGFQAMRTNTSPYENFDILPTYTPGISINNPNGLRSSQLPGISSNDLSLANFLLADVAGYVASYMQTFNVTSRTSGFVAGAPNLRHYNLSDYSGYMQDTWRIRPRVTLNLGVRYEYFSPVDERDALALLPVLSGRNYIQAMLGNSTLDFAGGAVGRPFYGKDWNNFAPNVGLSWDVFGNGRTAVRAGYSVHYVNDGAIATVRNSAVTNNGLTGVSSRDGLTGRLSVDRPAVETPLYAVPRTVRDNFVLDPAGSAVGMPDPGLRTPYVQQWVLGLQQEVKGTIFEVRYVGNKGTKLHRAFDLNQVVIRENGFLDDFKRAQNNGYLASSAGLGFEPRYNPQVGGSQPLPVFDSLGNRGNLTNATNRNRIQQGQAGALAADYFTAQVPGSEIFFRNPYTLGANVVTNYSNSSYHALQIDVRRRLGSALNFQGNYTWSKVLSDALGDRQTRFETFLDNANPAVERARAPFDLTHAIKGNFVYQLPFGEGKRLTYRPLQALLSGWTTAGNLTWQSGTPFSVLSTRGTVNRSGARSNVNTATSLLDGGQLQDVVGFFMTGTGPMFINPSAIGPDGRGVGRDGAAPFQGQAFFNPGPGELGQLQRRMFSGPWIFTFDFTVQKVTKIGERHSLELRMEAFNLTNSPAFYVGDEAAAGYLPLFNVNSAFFGQIADTLTDSRRFQFGLYYRF